MKVKGQLTEDEAFVYFLQVGLALEYLHSKGIFHRDVKSENVLLDKHGNALLCDLGSAGRGERETYLGTPETMAPEVTHGIKYGPKVDVWGLGLLLLELVAPDAAKQVSGLIHRPGLAFHLATLLRDLHHLSPQIKSLLTKSLEPRPQLRPDLSVILDDPWLNSMGKSHGISIQDYRLQAFKAQMQNQTPSSKRSSPTQYGTFQELANQNYVKDISEDIPLAEVEDSPSLAKKTTDSAHYQSSSYHRANTLPATHTTQTLKVATLSPTNSTTTRPPANLPTPQRQAFTLSPRPFPSSSDNNTDFRILLGGEEPKSDTGKVKFGRTLTVGGSGNGSPDRKMERRIEKSEPGLLDQVLGLFGCGSGR